MLIECIGHPGAGKTTMARALGRLMPNVKVRAGEFRKLQYRWARLTRQLRASPQTLQQHVDRLLGQHVPENIHTGAQSFNLVWRAKQALAYQESRVLVVSDELLVHGLFTTFGPTSSPPLDLRSRLDDLIRKTYAPARVRFVLPSPAEERWLSQVTSRRAGRSRYGRGTSRRELQTLAEDRLYPEMILPILSDGGYQVLTIDPSDAHAFSALGETLKSWWSGAAERNQWKGVIDRP